MGPNESIKWFYQNADRSSIMNIWSKWQNFLSLSPSFIWYRYRISWKTASPVDGYQSAISFSLGSLLQYPKFRYLLNRQKKSYEQKLFWSTKPYKLNISIHSKEKTQGLYQILFCLLRFVIAHWYRSFDKCLSSFNVLPCLKSPIHARDDKLRNIERWQIERFKKSKPCSMNIQVLWKLQRFVHHP